MSAFSGYEPSYVGLIWVNLFTCYLFLSLCLDNILVVGQHLVSELYFLIHFEIFYVAFYDLPYYSGEFIQ